MRIWILFIVLFISYSCSPKDKVHLEFDPRSTNEKAIKLSEIADDISYIILDDSVPIGFINSNIRCISNSIFFSVLDVGILEYNRKGEFKKKIGSIGRGPGEYTSYVDFTVDEKSGTVYIRDRGGIIIAYSEMGTYSRSFSLPGIADHIRTIELKDSRIFVFNYLQFEGVKYSWIVLDTLGNIIDKKERSEPIFTSRFSGSYGTYKYRDKLAYWNSYSDTVLSFSPDLSTEVSLLITPGEHRLPKSEVDVSDLSQYLHVWQIFETNRFFIITCTYKKPSLILIEKNGGKSYRSYLEVERKGITSDMVGGLENDLDGGTKFLPKGYFEENGREYLIGLVEPVTLETRIAGSEFKNIIPKYPKKKEELERLADNLKDTDNPILVLVRLN
jgi:hypothetical protein